MLTPGIEPRSTAYKAAALPLCYVSDWGDWRVLTPLLRLHRPTFPLVHYSHHRHGDPPRYRAGPSRLCRPMRSLARSRINLLLRPDLSNSIERTHTQAFRNFGTGGQCRSAADRFWRPADLPRLARKMAPEVRLELTALPLTAACSAVELHWNETGLRRRDEPTRSPAYASVEGTG